MTHNINVRSGVRFGTYYFICLLWGALATPLHAAETQLIHAEHVNAEQKAVEWPYRSHRDSEGYVNSNPEIGPDMSTLGNTLKRYIFDKRIDPVPEKMALARVDHRDLQNEKEDAFVHRLGHSSVLLKLDGGLWLTDPVFSKRASPVQWFGPKRFHPVPLEVDALPDIEGVIISHDHYDHLDKATIKRIHTKVKHFIVPLGVDKHLIEWGVPGQKIHALDWWQTIDIKNVSLTATPAQHFSGRGLFDRNHTLWASWVIKTDKHSVFFSGDGGYFDGFKLIGERFGPFDLTLMETGAYDRNWADIHMLPEQSVQAHIDLQGKVLMPIHNSTFDLALHPWYEPLERLAASAEKNGVEIATPIIGEKVFLDSPRNNIAWWRNRQSDNRSSQINSSHVNKVTNNKLNVFDQSLTLNK